MHKITSKIQHSLKSVLMFNLLTVSSVSGLLKDSMWGMQDIRVIGIKQDEELLELKQEGTKHDTKE